jgi:hypothetical protein
MLTFLSGFACGALSTVAFVAFLYGLLDRVVRPPSG